MNKTIRDEWVAALRSGNYEQGKHRLNDRGRFCCLGVLCEIAAQKGVITMNYDGRAGGLFAEVEKWSGVNAYGVINNAVCLTDMNDTGSSFEEIANTIEEYL